MNYDEKINKMLEMAKAINGRIKLTIDGRCENGEILTFAMSYPTDIFELLGIKEVFKTLRPLVDKFEELDKIPYEDEEYFVKLKEILEEHKNFIHKLFDDEDENWGEREEFLTEFIPQSDGEAVTKLESVTLELVTERI